MKSLQFNDLIKSVDILVQKFCVNLLGVLVILRHEISVAQVTWLFCLQSIPPSMVLEVVVYHTLFKKPVQ